MSATESLKTTKNKRRRISIINFRDLTLNQACTSHLGEQYDTSRISMDPSGILGNSSLPLTMSLSAHLRELAYVRRNPIEGRKPVFAHLSRPAGPSSTIKIGGSFAPNGNALNGKEKQTCNTLDCQFLFQNYNFNSLRS